jgi:hypothetical protein
VFPEYGPATHLTGSPRGANSFEARRDHTQSPNTRVCHLTIWHASGTATSTNLLVCVTHEPQRCGQELDDQIRVRMVAREHLSHCVLETYHRMPLGACCDKSLANSK